MTPDPQPHQVFLAGTYEFRRPLVLIMGIVALGPGVLGIAALIMDIKSKGMSVEMFLTSLIVGLVSGFLALFGIEMLWRWFTRSCKELEINDTGVRFGKTQHPWEAIQQFSGRIKVNGVQLFYTTRQGGAGRGYVLPTVPRLGKVEFLSLMAELEAALGSQHPFVQFGPRHVESMSDEELADEYNNVR